MKAFRVELKEKFRQTKNLPTIPIVVLVLQKALADDKSSAERIGRIISNDPSLSSNILRLANSAFYSSSGKPVSTISDAVVRIGLHEIGELCSTLAIVQDFRQIGRFRNHTHFWKHCISVAHAASCLAEHSGKPERVNRNEAYVTGLLHDLGTLILEQYFTERARSAWFEAKKKGIPEYVAELDVFRMDHGEVGGKLLQFWNIPDQIVQAVSFHHQPGLADPGARDITLITHFADAVCNYKDFVGAGNNGVATLPEDVMARLSVDSAMVASLIESVKQETKKSEVIIALATASLGRENIPS